MLVRAQQAAAELKLAHVKAEQRAKEETRDMQSQGITVLTKQHEKYQEDLNEAARRCAEAEQGEKHAQ